VFVATPASTNKIHIFIVFSPRGKKIFGAFPLHEQQTKGILIALVFALIT